MVTPQSFRFTEKTIGRGDKFDTHNLFVYIVSYNNENLLGLIDQIRDVLIAATSEDYNSLWVDPLAITVARGKFMASGNIRGEAVGLVR